MATSLFEYDCEAVRVRAKRVFKSGEEEHRKFSVDPNLTSFDILKSILTRAFDLSSEFIIYFNSSGEWMPLLSDWDLDVAILSAADPYLALMISERNFKKLPEETKINSEKLDPEVASPSLVHHRNNSLTERLSSVETESPVFYSLRQHVEKTIMPSLTSRFQRALNLAEETIVPKGQQILSLMDASGTDQEANLDSRGAVNEKDFKTFMNKVGEMMKPREFRLAVYKRGIEPQMRKVLWKHLLGVYPNGLTGRERVDYMKHKVIEYEDLKKSWMDMMLQGQVTDDLKYISNMVKKDVLRTDRHLNFFSGESNPNVTILYNILTTFALNHPSVGYCQGMSDLLSPILVVMMDEGHTYVSFCALMARLKPNFFSDGKTMTKKFEHLSQGLLFYDPEFFAYLKLRHADDLLYCYRWLLLEMKREFSFEDACTALEILWASLPPSKTGSGGNPSGTLLYEHKFGKRDLTMPTSFSKRENAFTNVVTLRKRLSSVEDSPKKSTAVAKLGKIEKRNRIQSAGSADEERKVAGAANRALMKKSKSLLSNTRVQKSLEKVQQPQKLEETTSSEPIKDSGGKKVKDLNEFFKMASASKGVTERECSSDTDEDSDVQETVDYSSRGKNNLDISFNRLPPPASFGDGNPFLMFMCIACLLQHRDYIIEQQLDYQEIAMYFDRMVRRHNVRNTLQLARKLFAEYLNDDWKRDTTANLKRDSLEQC